MRRVAIVKKDRPIGHWPAGRFFFVIGKAGARVAALDFRAEVPACWKRETGEEGGGGARMRNIGVFKQGGEKAYMHGNPDGFR
ncbi:hypothetical protein SAMN02799624_00528 [Paenibacillus sp. UNC496MF]|nr:hypothetical protein SAMN02799624_00528 [Paenibacillus sp. UNC496MF]